MAGTLKKNKPEITFQLLPNKKREKFSNVFAFQDLTMVSYAPEINKAVILISTHHHKKIISGNKNKSDINLFYNQTNWGVDAKDQEIEHSTCRRKT